MDRGSPVLEGMRVCVSGKMGRSVCATATAVLSLSCFGLFSAAQTVPAFVWGSGDYINHPAHHAGLQTSYEVLPSSYLAESLFGSLYLSGPQASSTGLNLSSLATDLPNLVSLFVLGQLRRGDISQHETVPAADTLRQAVEAAPSALFLPNVEATGAGLAEAVKAQSGSLLHLGACGSDVQDISTAQQLQAELTRNQGPISGLICESAGSALTFGLETQLQEAGRPYVIVYVGQADQESQRPAARSLISTSPANQQQPLCVGKCMVQVRLFEVIILLFTLLTALAAGLCMLHILDTPSRFETEKKDTTRHQD